MRNENCLRDKKSIINTTKNTGIEIVRKSGLLFIAANKARI